MFFGHPVDISFFRTEGRMSGSDMSGYTVEDVNIAKQLPKVEFLIIKFCKKYNSHNFIFNCISISWFTQIDEHKHEQ